MKALIFCFIILIPVSFMNAKMAKPFHVKSKMYYIEIPPNTIKSLVIQSVKCHPDVNDLKLEKFQKSKKVVNGEVDSVVIVADSGRCKNSPISSVWSEKVSIPKSDKWTHLQIFSLSDNIMVLDL